MDKYLQPTDDVIQSRLILAITCGNICSEEERKLLLFLCRHGGMVILIMKEISLIEFENSIKVTNHYQPN